MTTRRRRSHRFSIDAWSIKAAHWAGSATAILLAVLIVLVWAVLGPLFHFSDTWQLVINTVTTLITFLMVFLIQRAQNRDTAAIQVKLNELITAIRGARNDLVNVEDLPEEIVSQIRRAQNAREHTK